MTSTTLNLNGFQISSLFSILESIQVERKKIIPNIYFLKKKELENETNKQVNYQQLFSKTIIQYKSFEQDYEKIKISLIEAIDSSDRSIKYFDALIKAIDDLTIFFINNWKYFSQAEQNNIYLATQKIPRSNNIWSIINKINFRRIYLYFKTIFKYWDDLFKPPSENRFIILAKKLDDFVETVENLSKKYLSKNNNSTTINLLEENWIDWEDHSQINRIKQASRDYQRRREEESKMTEDEIQSSRDEFQLLEKIIAEYH